MSIMLSKKIHFFWLCFLASSCSCLFSETPSKPLHEFANELRRSIDITKTVSFGLVLSVLQQGYEICTAIEKIDPKVSFKLGAQCKNCQNKIMSCAELAGCLVAIDAQNQLDEFKKLLSTADQQAINKFMANVANERQIKCSTCDACDHWIALEQKP